MKTNEKIYIIIIIVLFLIASIFAFRACDISGDGRTDAAITRQIHSISTAIRESIKIASYISRDYNELIKQRDEYRDIAEQLRAGNRELEQRYIELQKNANELREYQRRNQQEIRNLENTCRAIGTEIDGFGNDVEGLGSIIRAIQDGATEAPD